MCGGGELNLTFTLLVGNGGFILAVQTGQTEKHPIILTYRILCHKLDIKYKKTIIFLT